MTHYFPETQDVQEYTKISGKLGALWSQNGKSLWLPRFFPLPIGSATHHKGPVLQSQINGKLIIMKISIHPLRQWRLAVRVKPSYLHVHQKWLTDVELKIYSTTQDCIEDYKFPQKEHSRDNWNQFSYNIQEMLLLITSSPTMIPVGSSPLINFRWTIMSGDIRAF